MANEDAWTQRTWRNGAMIAIADGLGSRPRARLGAVAACRAAVVASREAVDSKAFDAKAISRQLETGWYAAIAETCDREDAATTCLWALKVDGGPLLLGQAGDGLAVVRWPDGIVELLVEREGFANETDALGLSRPPEWHCFEARDAPIGTTVLLATDGVSDDLTRARIGDFVHYVASQFGPLQPRNRSIALRRELRAWPTPHHLDDKTLAILWVAA